MTMRDRALRGRVIAVTGASKGIGWAVTQALTAQGARVIAGARDVGGLQLDGAEFWRLDVTDEASVDAFARAAVRAGVDALVNNAGVGSFQPVEEITPAEYRRVMDTNVLGTLLVTRGLIPHFRERYARGEGSQVVNVTSDVSARTFAGGALYTASKYAQRAVTQALAYEGRAYGLRVTEIRPGMVDTFFAGSVQGAAHKAGWLRPDDVADAVLYALTAPLHARIDEVLLHPVEQDVVF
ncbi:SDR family oxidoreductase [Deinococcus sp. YIM 77859]|uniref:SDR family oxidoreductase n=1 Tax=Deinococcus sp. YIM 77859 TaxID=1540221 RepID=UPI000A8CD1DC|nr:SDR family NAD(P)-dependent oxidoreductase [Deinococcus sp. YIM 77859]